MRPGRSPETLVNGATVVHERLTHQALMHHARSAVTAIAVAAPWRPIASWATDWHADCPERLAAGFGWGDHGLVFTTQWGGAKSRAKGI